MIFLILILGFIGIQLWVLHQKAKDTSARIDSLEETLNQKLSTPTPGISPKVSPETPAPEKPPPYLKEPLIPEAPVIPEASVIPESTALSQEPKPTEVPQQPPAEPAGTTPPFQHNTEHPKQAARPKQPDSFDWKNLEAMIGGNILNKVGILALIIGMIYFLKYSYDSNWVGPLGRVLIGGAVSFGLMAWSAWLRTFKRYNAFSQVILGGGICVFYADVFVGTQIYTLFPPAVAFLLLMAATGSTVFLSARLSSLPISIIGLIGGYLTPFLASGRIPDTTGLFIYLFVLNVGILSVGYLKKWPSLNALNIFATLVVYTIWDIRHYNLNVFAPAFIFLTATYLLFLSYPIIQNVLRDRPTQQLDLSILFGSTLFYSTYSYLKLDDLFPDMKGVWAIAMALVTAGLSYSVWRVKRIDRLLIYTLGGLSLAAFSIAIPLQFDNRPVAIGWSVEAALLIWIGFRTDMHRVRLSGWLVLSLAISHIFLFDEIFTIPAGGFGEKLLSGQFMAALAFTISTLSIAFFYKRYDSICRSFEREYGACEVSAALGGGMAMVIPFQLDLSLLTAIWALIGVFFLFLGQTWGNPLIRVFPLGILAIAAFRLSHHESIWEVQPGGLMAWNSLSFLNFSATLFIGIDLAFKHYRDLQNNPAAPKWEQNGPGLMVALSAFLALALPNFLDGQVSVPIWTLIALLLTAAGFWMKNPLLGWGVIALVAWVLVYSIVDLRIFNSDQRIASSFLLDHPLLQVITAALILFPTGVYLLAARKAEDKLRDLISIVMILAAGALIMAVPEWVDERIRVSWWALEALFFVWLGLTYSKLPLRSAGMIIWVLAALHLLVSFHAADSLPPLVNFSFLNKLIAIGVIFTGALFYHRLLPEISDKNEWEDLGPPSLAVAGGFLLPWVISQDFWSFFDQNINAKRLSVSIIWGVLGSIYFAVGITKKYFPLRIFALGILTLVVLKVFLLDLSFLHTPYRIISFIGLGALLLGLSLLYQKFKDEIWR